MIKPRNIIVTGCNDLYLPFAKSLLRSLRALPFSSNFDIGVFDVGLSEASLQDLTAMGGKVLKPRADIDYPDREAWEREAPYFRAMTARPFLRDYFPGYDAYMWLDADSWAQTSDAVDLMLEGASKGHELYIASEIDRDYQPYFLSSQPWEYHLKWYRANFPAEAIATIFPRPMLNNGVWALNATSAVWKAWSNTYSACLKNIAKMTREQFMCDQLSLNMAVYTQGLPLKIMPAEFNWLTLYSTPMWDEEKQVFVRPTIPRTTISILHLTHANKAKSFDIATTEGQTIKRSLFNA